MKKTILFLCFLSALQALSADHHTATSLEENPFNAGVRLAMLGDLGNWDILTDFTAQYRGDDPFFTSFTAGGYYRLHRNLKGGLFYTLQTGALHEEDWIRISGDQWRWEDTSDRFEHLLTADLSPRVLLPFLPGGNWTFSLKKPLHPEPERRTPNLPAPPPALLVLAPGTKTTPQCQWRLRPLLPPELLRQHHL